MPEKLLPLDMIMDDTAKLALEYIQKWSIRTSKSAEAFAFHAKMENALTPSNMRTLIKYVAGLEEDRVALRKADEQLRRISYKCYGKCPHYSDRIESEEKL